MNKNIEEKPVVTRAAKTWKSRVNAIIRPVHLHFGGLRLKAPPTWPLKTIACGGARYVSRTDLRTFADELGKGIGAGIRALKEGIKDPLIEPGKSVSAEPGPSSVEIDGRPT